MSRGEYTHILLAVGLEVEDGAVIDRGCRLRDLFQARLTLLHVVGNVPKGIDYSSDLLTGEVALPESFDLENQLIAAAKDQLDALGERIGVPPGDRQIRLGKASKMILEAARELNVDLIVIGARERRGLFSLLGWVSPSVVKHEVCDVLAVHIDPADRD